MKTVVNNINEIIIKNSRFISLVYNVNCIDDVNKMLSNVENLYKGYTHCCYAYIIDNLIKAYDDGEPGGTAGLPILNVLIKENVNHVICIVVRYFGGIKLGSGGLIRAYSKCCKEVIKGNLIELLEYIDITITFDYENIDAIDYLIKDSLVVKEFSEKVVYKIKIEKDHFNNIKDSLLFISKIQ